jgi:transcriptional regulator with XRE-family HTH domain
MSATSLSGKAIASRRKAAGLTQETLAYKAGLSLFTLSKIESTSRNRDPRFSTVAAIAGILGCRIDDLTEQAA